jgi:uncharacterized protein (TIGR00730 family)
MNSVCVFCSSSEKIDPAYYDATRRLAELLVEEGIHVVFGGGHVGLMRQLADTVIEKGGSIKGVMPTFMKEVEWAHPGVTDWVFTETMQERQAKYMEGIDGVVTLPGGSGTLEELLQVIVHKRLGLYTDPIVILNTRGYFDPLREMLNRCVSERFMQQRHLEMWTFVDEPEEVIPALKQAPDWNADAISFAAVT